MHGTITILRSIMVINIFLCASNVIAQTGTFTDKRDQKQYQTIVIGKSIWFREHLQYETKRSYFPNYNNRKGDPSNGNYYSNTELDTVCPAGWHVATLEDWEEYVRVLTENNHLPKENITVKFSPPPNNSIIFITKDFNILQDTLLQLRPVGWVEGNKIANTGNLTLWIMDTSANDNKYHVHMAAEGFIKHTHTHHVIDKPKRIRKFAVRCVCAL